MDEDRVAVRLGAHGVLGRDIAQRAELVLDDDVASRERADLFGKEPHDRVGAAAGAEGADEMDILIRVALRAGGPGQNRDGGTNGHGQLS